MALISITGAIGSGKDTVAELIQKHSPVKFENKKFAEKLKQMVAVLTGCSREDLEDQDFKNQIAAGGFTHPITKEPVTYRWILQYMGTELFRDRFDPDTWVKSTFADYRPETSDWLITDMRFPNELKHIEEVGGISVLIMRFKPANEWAEDMKEIFLPGIKPDDFSSNLISKQEFLDLIIAREFVQLNHPEFQKLTHVGERGLWQAYTRGEINFKAIIRNSGTLLDLENKIIKFIDEQIVEV